MCCFAPTTWTQAHTTWSCAGSVAVHATTTHPGSTTITNPKTSIFRLLPITSRHLHLHEGGIRTKLENPVCPNSF